MGRRTKLFLIVLLALCASLLVTHASAQTATTGTIEALSSTGMVQ
jgi:hypothetical protein